MNKNIKFFLLCPVPDEQKPINEYIGLKENFLTSWTTLTTKNYEKKIISVATFFFLTISLFQVSSFQGIYYLTDWILENLFLTTLFLSFLFLILLSRWKQNENRFQQARLFYEEASWYDGQIWEKPLGVIKNDKLLSTQKIRPIRKRLEITFFQLISFNFFFFFLFQLEL
jgi:hypothetical protein